MSGAAQPVPAGQRLLWHLEAGLARLLLALLRALPPAAASTLAGRAARAIGPTLPVSRVADENLRAAMPELCAAERRRIVRGVWENLGRTVGEFPHIATLRFDTPSGPGMDVVNAGVLHAQAARGGPAIFVSGHIGNWEVLPPACARYGMPFSSFYRAAGNPLIDALITELRNQAMGTPVPLFPKGAAGARGAIAHLARKNYLGMLVDQKLNDGIPARLFGMTAWTAPATAVFALRYRCPIIMGHVQRVGPARFRLVVEDPLPLPVSGDREADVAALTQAINDVMEGWIRARPESWLWLHRRWPKEEIKAKTGSSFSEDKEAKRR